jgi:hypothetical protein
MMPGSARLAISASRSRRIFANVLFAPDGRRGDAHAEPCHQSVVDVVCVKLERGKEPKRIVAGRLVIGYELLSP